jgi:hypothetical protein
MFGDNRALMIHYFLADDTIEIREVIGANSGRDSVPVFLKRQKLPKKAPLALRQPGEITDRTVLNVFGPMGHGGRYILDSLKTGAVHTMYYTDADLQMGSHINVYGRTILVTDADDFTKDFYKTKYGVDKFNVVTKGPAAASNPRVIPPYNGFGSEEDSLCSCMGLIPKPPQRDFIKFMEKDQSGLNSNVLRFVAFMKTDNPVDAGRKFTVSYFLSDDTISVFEPPQRNSGVIGGKFLERGRIQKPGQELFKSEMSEYYKAQDLYVGATANFNDHIFVIVDADEYAMAYMENHTGEFPVADLENLLSKLKCHKEKVQDCIGNQDSMNYETFSQLLTNAGLVEHEVATIGRAFAVRQACPANLEYARAVAQEQLRKKNFEDFARWSEACAFEDSSNSGRIGVGSLNTICRAFKLPLTRGILNQLFKLSVDDKGTIDYNQFIDKLNWRDNLASTSDLQMPSTALYGDDGAPVGLQIEKVDCKALLANL